MLDGRTNGSMVCVHLCIMLKYWLGKFRDILAFSTTIALMLESKNQRGVLLIVKYDHSKYVF